jgi:hypothetical protein
MQSERPKQILIILLRRPPAGPGLPAALAQRLGNSRLGLLPLWTLRENPDATDGAQPR